jgi:glycosyltransferase involved in cell wall biosynthesis
MSNKKVSVIIPFYNGVGWLHEAVDSVLNQTYNNFEIIIVNDGSPEDVSGFLEKYKERINYVFKENGGPAAARNLALKMATGSYIAFLDADDIWLPTKTEKQIAFMEEKNIVWSHTGFYNWYPEDNKLILKNNSRDHGNVFVQSFMSLRANTPAIIIKKECLDEHPEFFFYEDMRYSEDSSLWSKISYHYPLGLLKEPLIKVRQRGTNADLFSLIRYESKVSIYSKIKQRVYSDIPKFVLFIYKIYIFQNNILEFMKDSWKVKKPTLEFIGKIFWTFPFILERIYLKIITFNKNNAFTK